MTLLPILIVLVFLYTLVSQRLERTVFTAPIVFTAAGMLTFLLLPGLQQREGAMTIFLRLAEVCLVLLLFTDASRTDLRVLRNIRNLPVRLLSTGMLLTILLGMVGALPILPHLSIWEAGILSAILAPTDAGLGLVIVNSPKLPMRIRQALNVEAGLNDGLSVPFLMFFIALAQQDTGAQLLRFMVEQLGYGSLVGLAICGIGGELLRLAKSKEWMDESLQQLAVVTLPLLCMLASEPIGASMFISAFVGGLAVQLRFPEAGKHSVEFTDEWGQILSFAVFYLFGLFVQRAMPQFTWDIVLYAVLSLTLVRMVPVAIALLGTGLSRATVLFMGWFGPRGLASIVLGLVYLELEAHLPGESTIRLAVMMTVFLSIFAHGLSALPGISAYARRLASMPEDAPDRRAT